MKTVYVVVPDEGCEFGAPVAVFSIQDLADDYVEKQRTKQVEAEGFVRRGYFTYPFNVDDEARLEGKTKWAHRDGKVEVF